MYHPHVLKFEEAGDIKTDHLSVGKLLYHQVASIKLI